MEDPFIVTASASSSSATSRTSLPSIDLGEVGLLGSLARSFLDGRDLELWRPYRGIAPGALPETASRQVDRRALAKALGVANASYGHPRSHEMARRLADPETRVVVTGQQPGILGGPLYTLTKAVAAAKWAAAWEEAGVPAVAVFWVATEDHDFREVSRTTFFTPDGPKSFDLGDDEQPLAPVGMRSLGSEITGLLDRLREASQAGASDEWLDLLAGWYRPEARFGEAFCRLMAHLLGERCPLLLDSMLPGVKTAQQPWLLSLVDQRLEISTLVGEREAEVRAAGHELQVRPQPGTSPLFVIHSGQRRRVVWKGENRLGLRGLELDEPIEWLETAIRENPSVVTPGVLVRPAIQDAILGTSLQILGPGEMAYLPQVAPAYEVMGLDGPQVTLRPQTLILEGHLERKLDSSGLELAALLDPSVDLDDLLASEEETAAVEKVRGEILGSLETLHSKALSIDKSLEGPWGKTRNQVERALEAFSGKLRSASARRDEVERRRAELLRTACRPLGGSQERIISTSHYPGKYGEAFVAALFEQVTLDPGNLQVVRP